MADIQGLRDKYATIPGERFFAELFENKEYLPAKEAKPKVVIDCGACAGEFSAYIYDTADTIYALEPFPSHFNELSENVKEFKLTKIKPFRLALSNMNGQRNFSTTDSRGGNKLDDAGAISVEVSTLAEFMKDNKIKHVDCLKIDIENGEGEVFNSADFKEVAANIDMIIGEHLGPVNDLLISYGFTAKSHGTNTLYERTQDVKAT